MPTGKTPAKRKTESVSKKGKAAGTGAPSTPRPAAKMGSAKKDRLTETPPQRQMTNGPTDTEIKAWLIRATDLAKEEKAVKSDMATVRQAQGVLKKDIVKAGGNYDDFKDLFLASKMTQEDAEARLKRRLDYHAAVNIRVSFDGSGQGSLDDVTEPPKKTDGTRDLDDARAETDGYNSGREGSVAKDNPHHAGTSVFVAWEQGRSEGAKDTSRKISA